MLGTGYVTRSISSAEHSFKSRPGMILSKPSTMICPGQFGFVQFIIMKSSSASQDLSEKGPLDSNDVEVLLAGWPSEVLSLSSDSFRFFGE